MLVVEGCDGSGKTHLVQKLSEDIGWPIATKSVGPDTQPLTDLKVYVNRTINSWYQRGDSKWKIHDRFTLFSESLYGPILRGKINHGFLDYQWLRNANENFWRARPTVVLCMPSLATVLKNVEQDAEEDHILTGKVWQPKAVVENTSKLFWAYYCWAATHPSIIVHDYERDAEWSYALIVESAVHRRRNALAQGGVL